MHRVSDMPAARLLNMISLRALLVALTEWFSLIRFRVAPILSTRGGMLSTRLFWTTGSLLGGADSVGAAPRIKGAADITCWGGLLGFKGRGIPCICCGIGIGIGIGIGGGAVGGQPLW